MIYIDKIINIQPIYVPKNGDYNGKMSNKKTYEDGYKDGYKEGLYDCLETECECPELDTITVEENGVYQGAFDTVIVDVKCPPCEDCKVEEYNITINSNIEEYTASDYGLDGFSKVNIDATEFGDNRYNEGYNQGKSECGEYPCPEYKEGDLNVEWESGWNSNVWNASNEGLDGYNSVIINAERALQEKYNQGYEQGKSECGEGGSCNISSGSFEFQDFANGHFWKYANEYGLDGWDYIDIDASSYGRQKYEEGYNQGKSEGGECPECPELTELNVTVNGSYEGAFNKVNVNVTTDFSSEQVENKYNLLAFITRNTNESQIVLDKTKLVNAFDIYIPNGSIIYSQFKNGICLATDGTYLNPDYNGGSVVRGIEDGAIDWNKVEELRTYTITTFGENMTRDKGSNLRSLYIYASTFKGETVVFKDGCFATSNLLQKIVFEEPFNVVVYGNPFEGFDSWGQLIVKGEESNRSKYTELINLLPSGWEVIFNPDYSE